MNNLSNFTNSALAVLRLADKESRRLGHNFICTEQLLVGILSEETNQAGKYLVEKGLTIEILKRKIEEIIGRGAGFLATEIPFTPKVNKILKMAIEIAKDKSPVMPEHLFKGILDVREGIASEILKDTVNLSETQIFIDNEIDIIVRARQQFRCSVFNTRSSESLRLEVQNGLTLVANQLAQISYQLEFISKTISSNDSIVSNKERLAEIDRQIKEIKMMLNRDNI